MICHKQSNVIFCSIFFDTSYLVGQHKIINKIENKLNYDFFNRCGWFEDNQLSIHFGEDKTKPILFAPKFKRKNMKKISYKIWGYTN